MGYTFFYKAGDKELNFCLLFNVLFSWCLWYRSSAPCHMQCSKRFGSKDSVPKHLSLRRSSGRGHIMPLKSFDIHITYIYWYRNSINSLRSWEAACTISMKYPLASFGPMGWGGGTGGWTGVLGPADLGTLRLLCKGEEPGSLCRLQHCFRSSLGPLGSSQSICSHISRRLNSILKGREEKLRGTWAPQHHHHTTVWVSGFPCICLSPTSSNTHEKS